MSAACLEFLELVGRLKDIKRTGWVLREVSNAETVSGHMYRMAVMTLLLPSNFSLSLDKDRCVKLCLVHDMAECIVGDITPFCGISKDEKHKKENDAMVTLTSLLDNTTGTDLMGLYKEYEEQKTVEAKFVKDLDRFDMILQAFEYEKVESCPGRLEEFFISTSGQFTHPWIIGLVEELNKQRQLFANKFSNQ